jgi:transposase
MAFIIKQKRASGRIDIHLAESVHRPGKTPCHKRLHLGTLDLESNELILSKKQSDLEGDVLALLSKKGIAFSGKRRSSSTRPSSSTMQAFLSSSVRIEELGRIGVLGSLARESGLFESLTNVFGCGYAERILRLAMHQVCEKGAVYLALDWWLDIGGVDVTGLSSSAAGDLLVEVGASISQRRDFFRKWFEVCGMPKALIHDTSSISSHSELLENVEWGYNRDGDKLPQVNLALVVSQSKRLPLWYRILPGSIPDVASLKATTDMLRELGLSGFSFTLDRGYYSMKNLAEMLAEKIEFTIGVPLHLKQAKEIIRKNLPALKKFKRRFLAADIPVGHVYCQFDIKTTEGVIGLTAHLYYSKERHHQTSTRFEKTVLELAEKTDDLDFKSVDEGKTWLKENARGFAKYFSVSELDGDIIVKTKNNAVAAALKTHGLTLLVTSERIETPERKTREVVLADYRSRDMAEKMFDAYKNATGNARLKTGGDKAAEGRVFLAFIAMTLHALLENKLYEAGGKRKLCVPVALAVLRKIKQLVSIEGNKILLEVPKKTRELVKNLGLETENLEHLRI